MQVKAGWRAFKVALIYVIVAGAWSLLSDELVRIFISDPKARVQLSLLMGLGFVVLTGILLYLILIRTLKKREMEIAMHRKADEKILASERFLQSTLDALGSHIAILDEHGTIIAVNAAWHRFAGENAFAGNRGVGQNYLQICRAAAGRFSEGAAEVARGISEIIAGERRDLHCEYPCHSREDQRWFVVHATRFGDDGPARVVVAHENITQRKQAEMALQLSDFSVNFSSLATFWINPAARIVRVNPAACAQLGYAEAELLALSITDLDPDFPPARWPEHWQELRGKKQLNFETQHRHKDGRLIPVEVSIHWFEFGGQEYNFAFARDISDRKQAEMARQLSEFFFQDSQRAANIGSYQFNFVSGIWESSEVLDQIFGIDGGFIKTVQGWLVLIHPQDREMMERYTNEEVMTRHQPFNKEYRIVRPADGEVRWVLGLGKINFDAAGRAVSLIGTIQDITQRKEADQRLRASEERLRLVTENAQVGMVVINAERRYTFANAAYYKILGLPPQEIFGQRVADVLSPVYAEQICPRLDEAFAGRRVTYELKKPAASGDRFFSVTYELVRAEDAEPLVIVVIADITESKQQENELRWKTALMVAQVDATLDGILVVDSQARKILQNVPLLKLFNIPADIACNDDDKKMLQHVVRQIKNPALFMERVAHLYAHPKEIGRDEIELKDGRVFDRYSAPVHDKAGTYLGRIWTFRDITKSRLLEAQLRQAQKMEAIGTLAGGIAHDFNNILAAMFGYGYLLQQDTLGNVAAQEDLAEILKAATRAKDLVQQILTFSRQREQKRLVIPLDTVVKEAMKFLRASLPANLNIEMDIASDAPHVLADPTQIYQVTINLATNALHAMEGQSGQLTVSLGAFQPSEKFLQSHLEFRPIEYARLTIADTGHGMDAKTLERIFEPFFTTKPVGKGTGLGLAVVHGIVQSHDGFITVESEVGKGTAFNLYFPAQTSAAPPADAMPVQVNSGRGQKILLLDDEPALTVPFQRLLQRLKYQVIVCNHAPDAVEMVRENPALFDAVITDLTMPEMNGLEVARQVHNVRAKLPVILVSGLSPELNRDKLLAAGIFELLEKPVTLATLADVLQRALQPAKA